MRRRPERTWPDWTESEPRKDRTKSGNIPHDPDARITKMKDGRTHLAHKVEHAADMKTGAILAVTVQGADLGDTTTIEDTMIEAARQMETLAADPESKLPRRLPFRNRGR